MNIELFEKTGFQMAFVAINSIGNSCQEVIRSRLFFKKKNNNNNYYYYYNKEYTCTARSK